MRPILILTKNLMLEQELQHRLQHLNYEVFCSVKLYDRLRTSESHESAQMEELHLRLKDYQAVILSETISDNEIQEILPILQSKDWIILRKFSTNPSENKEVQLKTARIDGWLGPDQSIDSLREQLSEKLPKNQEDEMNILFLYPNKKDTGDIEKLKSNLTKRERMVLDCLAEAQGEPVSREELCSYLWNDTPTNSHLSQSSVLIKRIKSKLELAGYDSHILQTVWGSGYHLTKSSLLRDYYVQAK